MRCLPKKVAADPRVGAAAVEMAVIAPLFIGLILGAIQSGMSLDTSAKMYAAVRQAGRLAAMDYDSRLQPGQSGNDKVAQDIKNQLTADGLPGDKATVSITWAEGGNAGSTFNLKDPNADLQLFKIDISFQSKDLGSYNLMPPLNDTVSASIVFRKGRNQLVME